MIGKILSYQFFDIIVTEHIKVSQNCILVKLYQILKDAIIMKLFNKGYSLD